MILRNDRKVKIDMTKNLIYWFRMKILEAILEVKK